MLIIGRASQSMNQLPAFVFIASRARDVLTCTEVTTSLVWWQGVRPLSGRPGFDPCFCRESFSGASHTSGLIIIIIAFKDAIRDFFTISPAPRTVSNTCAQVARADHVQHIERLPRASVMVRATWYEGTAQLLSLTELKSHLFELCFIG